MNAGAQPTLVTEWAKHSVQVLLRVYAKCIEGQDAQSRKLVENVLGEPDPTKAKPEEGSRDEVESDSPDEGDSDTA